MALRRDGFRLEKARHTAHSGRWLKARCRRSGGALAPGGGGAEPRGPSRRTRPVSPRGTTHPSARPRGRPRRRRAVGADPVPWISPKVLAVNMGERNPATAAPIAPGVSVKPMYLGRKVRGVRRHHAWRRPRLQEKRALRAIKAQRNRESPRGVRSSPRPSTDWWPWRGRTAPPSRSGNSREATGTRGRGGGSPVRELDAVCADPWDGAGQGRVGGRPRGVGGRGPHQSVVPSMPEPREARPTGRVPVPLGNVGVAWKCRHVQRSQHRQPSGETGGPGGPRWGRLDTAHEPGAG